jgi:hypothetical protein
MKKLLARLSKLFSPKPIIKIYDENGNITCYEDPNTKYWYKQKFDTNNNVIEYDDSHGYWYKRTYDENNEEIYFEDAYGDKIDRNSPSYDGKIIEVDKRIYKLVELK